MIQTEKLKIYTSENKEASVQVTALALNDILKKYFEEPMLLLVSGGSSLEVLDYIQNDLLSERLTVTLMDERFSQEPEANNFLNLQKTAFYEFALTQNVNFIGTLPRPDEILEDMVIRFELALKNWFKENPNGKIVALFGLGADGHTSGILPFPENSQFFSEEFENNKWVAGFNAPGKHKYPVRATTTFTFFKLIDEAILFACGQEKKQAIQRLKEGKEQPHEFPALGLYETKHFQVFTDIK